MSLNYIDYIDDSTGA